jgi:uncharacterized protein (DUF305 family)
VKENVMKRHSASWLVSGLCLFLLGLTSIAAAHEEGAQEKSASLKHLEGLEGEGFERDFLKLMIHHHQSGIEMAELAQSKASHAEVRELGEKIVAAQRRETGEMTGWLRDWFKADPQPHFRDEASEKKMQRQMEKLKAAEGEEFDRLFLEAMTMHHRDGIAMAKLAPGKAKHEELAEAAKKMADDQSREVEQMMAWERSWSGKS